MKTTAQTRLARLTGLVLLSLLVFAAGVQVAQAAPAAGTDGRGGVVAVESTPTAGTDGRGGTLALATTSTAGTQGRGGVLVLANTPTAGTQGRGGIAAAPGALAASSGTSSTVAWILVGSALALLIIGLAAWASVRRRRQRSEPLSAAFCAQHPEHAMCSTA